MKKILTFLLCASLFLTGCGNTSKMSKSAIMGDGSGVGAEIGSPGGKDTKKTAKGRDTKKSTGSKDTKKTSGSKDTRSASAGTVRSAGPSIGDIMENKAADMAGINGVKVETVKDSKGYEAIKLTFDSGILFATGQYTLNQAAKESLSEFEREMRDLPETNIVVYGHTDNTGTAAANERVSLQRAKAVADYLKSLGIEASRIVFEGKSFREPIADNSTAEGRRLNRRVEVFVYANDIMIRNSR
ncbi:MAG TPA: OmpA family protein [Bacteroidales bacterium]|nr:OmpA family protein [Bacteroidales bacterium]